jgi:hypothetical protein
MYPTRAQVRAQFQAILDDPLGLVFDDSVFTPAFNEAFSALQNAFLQYQVPAIEVTAAYTLPANTTSLTPAQMGVTDLGDFIFLRERVNGTSDKFRELVPVDLLPQRDQGQHLLVYNWSGDTFYFVGATGATDLQLRYESNGGAAPSSDLATIGVENSLTFLSNYAVGAAGPRKGYDEIAARARMAAVGPRYDQGGGIGGELFRLIQTRVRSRQKILLQPKRFAAGRRVMGRRPAVPYATGAIPGVWG